MAEENIFIDGELRDEGKLLIDDGNARRLAVRNVLKALLRPLVKDFPLIAAVGMDAGEHLHQCGFPRPVLTHKAVDLPALHFKVHAVERLDARKLLGDPAHFQKNVVQESTSFLSPNCNTRFSGRMTTISNQGTSVHPRTGCKME